MTVEQLVNLALLKLGITQTITTIGEQTREAFTANLVYDTTLRSCLRRHPWSFATKYATLLLTRGPFWNTDPTKMTAVEAWNSAYSYEVGDTVRQASVNYYCILAHTNQTPPNSTYWSTAVTAAPLEANGDWRYSYRYPADCLFARRFVPPGGEGRRFSDMPIEHRRHRDENGLLLGSNWKEAVLEYTMLDCANLWTDDLFLKYFTWSLAEAMCPSLERAQKTTIECFQMAEGTLRSAGTVDMREQQQYEQGDADWVRGRTGSSVPQTWTRNR